MRHSISLLLFLVALSAHAAEPRTIAVNVPADAQGITEALQDNGWIRWLLDRNEGLAIDFGPEAVGETEILVRPLPVTGDVQELLKSLPVRLNDGVLELDGTAYREQQLALAVRLPQAGSPQAPKRTWLITGHQPERLAELTGLVLAKEGGGRVWGRNGKPFDYLLRQSAWLERSGVWVEHDRAWAVDRGGERDDFKTRDAYYAGMKTLTGRWTELRASTADAARPEIRALAARLDAATGEMAQRLPVELKSPVRLVVESDHVAQGRYLSAIGAAVRAADGTVHLIFHADDDYAYRHQIARELLARAGVAGLSPWIEDGSALWLSRQWFGRDFEDWLPRFAAARLLPTAEQLLAEEKQSDSSAPLWVPVAASLVGGLPGETLHRKLTATPDAAGARVHLTRLAALEPPPPQRNTPPSLPFLDGISFAMLNRLEGGYHAPAVDLQLERLRDLGANSVSLMPFAYQPKPTEPALRFMNRSPTSETDVGVIYAARRAHAAGFHVLWKPHIWLSYDSWPGDVEMPDEAAWAAWWSSYRRYVAHHALLAQWTDCDLFSIGVELGKTVGREREWNELIASVRWLYDGAVTYSGNWHGDYDQAPFWDRLDFVGVDAYFPLAHQDAATPLAIAEGARGVAEKLRQAAERFGKPILLTEVGYAARTGAWVEPHREGGDFSTEHQALAYEALLGALGRPPWLRGIFAWKAFSAERDAAEQPDFRFLGRPAEAVLSEYFQGAESAAAAQHTAN